MHQFVYETHWWMYGQQILNSEWNGVLWYVRDIMTMMLLAPLYSWLFVVNNKWLYFVVTALLFCIGFLWIVDGYLLKGHSSSL